jgi:H+/gluconate symporter-like permease
LFRLKIRTSSAGKSARRVGILFASVSLQPSDGGEEMEVFATFLSLALLMWTAYRGYPVILLAPLCALLAVGLSGMPLLPNYTEVFMVKAADYVKLYFPVFLLGAVFGKVMEHGGLAQSIASRLTQTFGRRQAVLSVVITCAVLTYGGVSLFVVAFAVYPFGAALFRAAGIPKRLLPAAIALGAFTFTMDALPGTPQIQNIIPTAYFKTDAFAAPVLGTLGSLIIFLAGIAWLNFRKNRLIQKDKEKLTLSVNESGPPRDETKLPDFWFSLLPLLLVLAGNVAFTYLILPDWYSEKVLKAYGGIEVDQVLGVWALVLSLTLGILAGILIAWVTQKRVKKASGFKKPDFRQALTAGVAGSLLAIMNTASEVGFGNVIAGLPGFLSITRALLSMDVNPLFSEALSINILAGITGSASGGMSIALDIMGQKYLEMAASIGLDPEVLHRIASMSAGGMDTLPHNGAVITLLAICGLTHREAYPDIFAITVIKTLVVPLMILLTIATGIV